MNKNEANEYARICELLVVWETETNNHSFRSALETLKLIIGTNQKLKTALADAKEQNAILIKALEHYEKEENWAKDKYGASRFYIVRAEHIIGGCSVAIQTLEKAGHYE